MITWSRKGSIRYTSKVLKLCRPSVMSNIECGDTTLCFRNAEIGQVIYHLCISPSLFVHTFVIRIVYWRGASRQTARARLLKVGGWDLFNLQRWCQVFFWELYSLKLITMWRRYTCTEKYKIYREYYMYIEGMTECYSESVSLSFMISNCRSNFKQLILVCYIEKCFMFPNIWLIIFW